jgi:DNA polymerase-3 subunit beta
MEVEQRGNDLKVAVPAKMIQDTVKALPEQPITVTIDEETFGIEISSVVNINGAFRSGAHPDIYIW